MKLLSKNEINKSQNADKAREISEGLKISRRVDSLRELQVKEEQTLEKYRNESLAEISNEINSLLDKKTTLLNEIKLLDDNLKRELSKTEKKRLEELKASLEKKEQEIKEKSFKLDLKEVDIACAIKETQNALARQKTLEENAKTLAEMASRSKEESQQTLFNARKIEENAMRSKDEAEGYFTMRESTLALKEKQIKAQEEENINIKRELEVEKIQLADQRATLTRAMERLRQNRLA